MPRLMFSDAPEFSVDARIRDAGSGCWTLEFGKSRYGIRRNPRIASRATKFTISTEWTSFELASKSARLMSGKLADGTLLTYRARPPFWEGEELVAPDYLEVLVGDHVFTGHKADGLSRIDAHDEDGNILMRAREPWQDSEAGVKWVIDLQYKLDDPNVQLALLLFPWASMFVSSWWDYSTRPVD